MGLFVIFSHISDEHRKMMQQEECTADVESLHVIHDIDALQQHGINASDINKIKAAGICTVRGLKMITKRRLCEIKGISEAKVDKIKEAANKLGNVVFFKSVSNSYDSEANNFITGFDFAEKRKACFKISTGSTELDRILGGGIESMAITEVFGEFRTGKTQLAHTLCVTTQMPGIGHSGGKVAYIDTENTFRPDRLRPIAARFNLDADAILQNVVYARAFTSEHQMELLDLVAAQFYSEPGVFKILIIDSIIGLFRVDYSGRGELSERQQKLAQMLSKVQKIRYPSCSFQLLNLNFSEEYNVVVYITNQMTADPGAGMTFQIDPKKPVGGNILAHASQTRVMVKCQGH
jgi:meiotic recombination protein DMC1